MVNIGLTVLHLIVVVAALTCATEAAHISVPTSGSLQHDMTLTRKKIDAKHRFQKIPFNLNNLTFLESKSTKESAQYINCWSGHHQSNEQIHIKAEYVPDLGASPFYFDNKISSCCFNGIFILYDQKEYNSFNFKSAVVATWGENGKYCIDLEPGMDNKASSIRFSGAPDGYKYSTLNIYEGPYYMGEEEYFYDDSPNLKNRNFGKSMILTGCEPWTLYDRENYGGKSTCVFPSDTHKCYPSFYRNESSMGWILNNIRSIKHGCYSKSAIHPLKSMSSNSGNNNSEEADIIGGSGGNTLVF